MFISYILFNYFNKLPNGTQSQQLALCNCNETLKLGYRASSWLAYFSLGGRQTQVVAGPLSRGWLYLSWRGRGAASSFARRSHSVKWKQLRTVLRTFWMIVIICNGHDVAATAPDAFSCNYSLSLPVRSLRRGLSFPPFHRQRNPSARSGRPSQGHVARKRMN